MVATAIMAPIALSLKCATAMTSQVLKFVGGARVTKVDEMLNSAAEASTEALFGFYKNFGFYAYIKTAEAIADKSQDILNALNSGREEATSVDAPLVESHDTVTFEEQAKKEIAAQNKKISEEEKKVFEDAEVARRIDGIKADAEARRIAEEASKESEIDEEIGDFTISGDSPRDSGPARSPREAKAELLGDRKEALLKTQSQMHKY